MRRPLHVAVVCVFASIANLLPLASAHAQTCTTSGNDVTCTNTGTAGNNTVVNAVANNGGNATITNSGTVGAFSSLQTFANGASGNGNASITNSGTIGPQGVVESFANGNGNASITNTGSVGAQGIIQTFANGNGNATITTSGTVGDFSIIQTFANGNGNATITAFGTIGADAIIQTFANGNGNATITAFGTIGSDAIIQTFANGNGNATIATAGTIGSDSIIQTFANGNGNASITSSATIGPNAIVQTFANGNGNATIATAGTIGPNAIVQTFANGNGNASVTNSGTIGANAIVQTFANGNGAASIINSGLIGGGISTVKATASTGNATIVNSGIILAAVSAESTAGTASLSNHAGSLIVGSISLSGPTKTLEFVGGNFVYTLQSMAGVQVNAHGAPFVVSGNTVAVLDPTGFALEDRSVMNFTGGVSSMLQDRFNGMAIAGVGVASAMPMSFAPQTAASDRIGAGHDAFAGLPSLSMSYASDDSKVRNARAMYTKAPIAAAPVNDITVWTSGFGGERHQSSFDLIQRARDDAFGGAIGVDRWFTPDWRFGLFAGGGSSRLRTDFNVQNVDSDYGFGGAYGRYDRHVYYVDFALFGGGISSKSTRQVANNLVGFETALASYNGWFISPDVTAGYRVFTNWGTITPKARVRYVGGTLDGYTETGSAQGLSVGSRNLSDAEERLGVELASTKPAAFGWGTLTVRSEVDAVGLQRLGDNTINAVLLAQNIAFTTPGRARAFGGAASGTVDWRPKSNVSLYLSAEGMVMDDHSSSVVGKGGVRVGF